MGKARLGKNMDVTIQDSITNCDREAWDDLAGDAFPFVGYHFLRALETTDCLGERTGWYPAYLTATEDGKLVGALVCYVKTNSYGEYIFDWGWAQGAEAAGLRYYPKLTSAVPFTPATGTKLLLSPGLDAAARARVRAALLSELGHFAARAGASSTHALFVPEGEVAAWLEHGFVARDSYQFHWTNDGYADFDAFLAKLKSKRRREVRRERQQARASGVRVSRLTGAALTPEHAKVFNEFYLSTIDKRRSFDYLTPAFFESVFATMAERLLLCWAETPAGHPVAGALNYLGRDTLFGRHWGSLGDYRALHFELCYYQGLEFAIENGLARFEAGAQGEHKLQRGFLPARTYSVHHIRHPGLAHAVERFLVGERGQVAAEMTELNAHSPFGYSVGQPREVAHDEQRIT